MLPQHKSASLFREPVAPLLKPTALQWEPANSDLLTILTVIFEKHGVFLAASGTSMSEISYCRMTDAARNVDLFIKIVPKRFASALQRSSRISNYVVDCGILSPAGIPTFPKVCMDGRVIFAYPFVEGRYLNNSMADLQRLGGALARLHTVLVNFPDAQKIARSQRVMRARMRQKVKDLLADQHWASGELSPARAHLQGSRGPPSPRPDPSGRGAVSRRAWPG